MILFRSLARSDFPHLERWLALPHVHQFWRESLDPAGLELKYGPRIDGLDPTRVFIIEYEARPVGWIQWYYWKDYPSHANELGAGPDSAGVDLAIGEPEFLGKGIGTAALIQFLRKVVFVHSDADSVLCDPESRNARSLGAFLKAGFIFVRALRLEGEGYDRCVMRLARKDALALRPVVG